MAYTYLRKTTYKDVLYYNHEQVKLCRQLTNIFVACLMYCEGLRQTFSGIIKQTFGFYVLTNGVFQHK